VKLRKYHRASAMGVPGAGRDQAIGKGKKIFRISSGLRNSVENNENPNILGVALI